MLAYQAGEYIESYFSTLNIWPEMAGGGMGMLVGVFTQWKGACRIIYHG